MVVYKDPNCGCCAKWVQHVRAAGFTVEVRDTSSLEPVKMQHGIARDLESCHTATVGRYVVEGHVPVADIVRMLTERPDVTGLAVPGMPVGSPGMEQGSIKDPYDVIAFDRTGKKQVYAKH